MPVPRVALIYDDTARPETTGTYCRRALGGRESDDAEQHPTG